MKYLFTVAINIKRIVLFALYVVIGLTLYELASMVADMQGSVPKIVAIVLFWAITAYMVLPWLHRKLTAYYVPQYFIGRVRTGDGLLGDPVNLAINGRKKEVERLFQEAGWVKAVDLNLKTGATMVWRSLIRKSYPNAPVSSLYLFNRRQDMAFQKEVNGNPHARHHIRLWKTPTRWWLPGGRKVDWLAGATYDTKVGFSTKTGQFTHKIDANIDDERDFTCASFNQKAVDIEEIQHFMMPYECRNGGGDTFKTDGSIKIVSIKDRRRREG